jgi:hypothetical protein
MIKEKPSKERDIRTVLRRHLGQRTVLGVAIPILVGHIAAAKAGIVFSGLTEKEIEAGFREIAAKFIKSDYHSTYIDRRLGSRGFLELSNGRYRIRQTLFGVVNIPELEALHSELIASLKTAYEQRQAAIKKLEETCLLPDEHITERLALVNAYLSQIAGNRGEMFEVISFAVLREYFRTFGFSLRRFSTTHANDGGMDFVAGEAIYQVTTNESIQKVRRDLAKVPGTSRVLVRPTVTPEIVKLTENEVLETIELKDLLHHFIAWLLARDTRAKRAKHLQQVLQIALEEFQRENKAESA